MVGLKVHGNLKLGIFERESVSKRYEFCNWAHMHLK